MKAFDRSLSSLVKKAKFALGSDDLSSALSHVQRFVERIITEPICTAQVFSSPDLDEVCQEIGRRSLAALPALSTDPWPERGNGSLVVYLISRFQNSGGHSRLIQDFIRAQPRKNHLILSTEIGGPSDHNYFSHVFGTHKNVRFYRSPRDHLANKLKWLQSTLIAVKPVHVYLFNHHQDSVSISALTPEMGLHGSFIHHGDHHLCLGVHLNHLAHIDLHPMGYHYCRDVLKINNQYLPLTFEDRHVASEQTDFIRSGVLTTATAARSNKVEIPYYVSYLDLIPQLLKVTGGRHIHIGKLTPWALRRIYSQLRKLGIQKECFVYIEWVPSVWNALKTHRVDLYIASFPYGAGLTLIEAMGAGIPVIMHQHMYSRVLSGLELAYPEAFSWSDPEKLLKHMANVRPESLSREKRLSRLQYDKFHRQEILTRYFDGPDSFVLAIPPLAACYQFKMDEWAAWAENQVTSSRILYRFLYRHWLKIRYWISNQNYLPMK